MMSVQSSTPSPLDALFRRRSSITLLAAALGDGCSTPTPLETELGASALSALDRRRSSLGLLAGLLEKFERGMVPGSAAPAFGGLFDDLAEDRSGSDGTGPESSPQTVPTTSALDVLVSDPMFISGHLLAEAEAAAAATVKPAAFAGADAVGAFTSRDATLAGSPATLVAPKLEIQIDPPAATVILESASSTEETGASSFYTPAASPEPAASPRKRGRKQADLDTADSPEPQTASRQSKRRRPVVTSPAVLAAMPKPPRRGRKDPRLEEMVKGMSPEQARLEKNRQSAKECRLRKKEYIRNLQHKVAEFEEREAAREKELAAVQAQLAQLQREYAALSGIRRG